VAPPPAAIAGDPEPGDIESGISTRALLLRLEREEAEEATQATPPSPPPQSEGAAVFPFGQCTWYVAQRRYVPWHGNAEAWYANAAGAGYSVGSQPRPGAIQVSRESYVGHVSYVESVDPDGTWTVSEMNYSANGGGWGRVSQRHIAPGQIPLIGFIYENRR
jgi:surface antigen